MPDLPEERRVVTALFADVVGSTALAERHDPEEARLIVGEAIARAVRIVEAYGGTVKDLAGDGMLALFGAPVAHEDDPERALRAALEIAASVAEYAEEVRRGWGVEGFGVRLGADTGEVVVGQIGAGSRVEYGATGDAVNIAARLQSAAEPGAVLAGEQTRRLAGDRFDWAAPVQLTLKGKSAPVSASRVLSVRDTVRADVAAAPLAGRAPEMAALQRTLLGMQAGRGGIVFICGEPGIGKTRLAGELKWAAASASVEWLEGRAVSYGASLAWWPVRDLLRGWLGVSAQEPELRVRLALRRRLDELFAGRAPDLQAFLTGAVGLSPDRESSPAVTALSPEALQYRTYEVLADLVAALAARGPLVVSIDDLHWADPTTLGLLDRLLPLAERAPVLFVFTMRPETDHGSWALRERAAREFRHLFTAIDLQPLDSSAEQDLLTSLTGSAIDPAVREAVIGYAEGNPLYLEELARAVGEQGGFAGASLTLPSTLEGVILARLDRLEPAWRAAVTAASASGRTFTFGLLQAMSGLAEPELRDAVHHLLRLDLLKEEQRWPEASYRFKHALIQEAAYRTLVTARRRDLHARAAAWLEARHQEGEGRLYGLIAHHWLAAEDHDRAATWIALAGEQALGEWALDEAVDHFRSLLPILERQGEEARSAELLFRLASTLHLAMRYREASEAWARAFSRWKYPEPPSAEPTEVLRIAVNNLPWSVDLSAGSYAANQGLFQQMWDRLLEGRPGPYVVPGLASSWDVSDDGRTYRFHLRDGVCWNDGQAMTSHDVVRAYRRIVDPEHLSTNATMLFVVENAEARSRGEVPAEAVGVQAVDERTVEVRLERPYPAFLFYALYPEFGPVREDLARSGPFQLVHMERASVVVERDPAYPRRRGGNVARVEWMLADDPDRLAADARENFLDAIWGHVRITGTPEAAAVLALPTPRVQTGFVTFAGRGEFLANLDLRRALALSVDRAALAPELPIYQDIATGGLVPPGLLGHTPAIAPPFDAEEARRALANSGHAGPIAMIVAAEQWHPYLDALVDSWREHLGVLVDVAVEPMAHNQQWPERSHVQFWQWVAHAPDAEYFLRNLLHGLSLSKVGGWVEPALDELLDRARVMSEGPARLELYHEADRLAIEQKYLVIPVTYGGIRWLVKPWVHGLWQWGAPWQSWDEVTIEATAMESALPLA